MTTVINVENLSKRYRLNSAARNTTLRDVVTSAVKSPFGRRSGENGVLWALREVNFALKQGETLGIIGHNGAGKSTLLKILSRITKPTTGTAEIRGRVGSLLEVGTGFHAELSGRENIFLNGAILGMKRREIERKFDEIVSFAEVEQFLETPVKHYSSGMFMRLAFSVAAHLEPEILLMDEVLAVGDVNFQLKCLDKMQEIRSQGRTILFVSHNMSAIARICSRSIALQKGQVISEGETQSVIKDYLKSGSAPTAEKVWTDEDAPTSAVVRLKSVRVRNREGNTADVLDVRQPVGLETTYEVLQPVKGLITAFHFYNAEKTYIFGVQDVAGEWRERERERGVYTSTAWLPGNFLNEGNLIIDVAFSSHKPETKVYLHERDVLGFEVIESLTGDTARGDYTGQILGFIRPLVDWETNFNTRK